MKMATTPPSIHGDEDFIDMEVTSSPSSSSSTSNVLCYTITSPSKATEFEFQKSSTPNEAKQPSPSPADELFYKGKLLPLHLPPRLQMVQNLLKNSVTAAATTNNTPLESCNISPSESCRVSCELNPDEYFFEWSTEWTGFISENNIHKKYSWSKKLKLVKQSILAQKLKASRAYLKTLFTKSACSNDSPEAGNEPKGKESLSNKYMEVATKKNPFGHIGKGAYPTIAAVIAEESANNTHRRSFSGAIKRHYSATKSSSSSSSSGASSLSSSFSINSNALYDLQLLKRSASSSSELEEGSIEGAIAHCKKSQQMFSSSNKASGDVGLCSLSASRVAVSEDKER